MAEIEAVAPDKRAKSKRIGALRGLAPFLAPYRLLIAGVVFALLLAASFTLVLPVAFRRVIDGFSVENAALIDRYFLALIGVAVALALATAARFFLVTLLGERVIADLRRALFDHVSGMSPGFYEKLMTAEVLTRLTSDTTVIQGVVGSTASIALRNILLLVGGITMMLVTSAKLTGMALLIVPAAVLPIILLGRRVRRLSRRAQDLVADSAALAGEYLQAAPTVQAMTYEAPAQAGFARRVEAAFAAHRGRIVARSALTAIVIFLVFSMVVGVVWIGARDVLAGTMSEGEMAQFVLYAVFTAGAVGALSEVWGELQRAAGATERIVELLQMENPIREPAEPLPPAAPTRGHIRFEDVSFHYQSRPDAPALHEVSFEIRPGETVALVGPSGAGKTTILQLLLRFYDPQAGRITLDGVPIDAMTTRDLRARLALVPQEPVIFADSVRANILFGRPEASEAEVIEAARAAAAHDFVTGLPEGYDSWLGERGVLLSGGQKQRIAIARAILRDAPVLVLDEATSALDAESERAVQAAVARLAAGRTTLVVAHRLATVKRADRIVVLEGGRVVATGTHDALVAEDGLYARLARLQFTEGLAAE
ncbi:ABC transporter transmembrane domain-containing protein [Paralimibaculum aggregatum]|uniref:ABC transporter transmembrane domain-containing protein n=1 Tax=Paralimibaculum aggregatum TaxID=3036245 RepID=A0ABQ6LS63_9RHOB|nr:ABC transporter transmembrane domain-containing protein [Limibaculum sp. NKW23]GMG84869.1 ABC transporter transmembrane domain-containing protein [Limibaculum sp. NKW23]